MSIAVLASRALIRVSGPDARPFLHNLLTQDVEGLNDGELRYGALLSPPGRLLFDLLIWGEADAVVLDVATSRRDALIQRLSMYRLRAQVEIAPDPRAVSASWLQVAPGFTADPRTPGLGGRRLGDHGAPDADEDARAAHALGLGVPDLASLEPDKDYPIELNIDLLNGVDFHKGCFVGQETTSRMKRRGTVKNRLLRLDVTGPVPPVGAEVLNGDLRAGQVRFSQGDGVVALMRLDRLDGALTVGGAPAAVSFPSWFPRGD